MANYKRNIKSGLTVLVLCAAAGSLTGCFKMGALFGSAGGGGTNNTASTSTSSSSSVNTTASVIEASQVLPTMAAVTGITPSTTTTKAFTANAGNFSIAGAATDVNPPLMFAYATVAAQMCNDLITAEKAETATSRRFFGCINFTVAPGTQFSGTCLQNTADIMTRSFFGADVTTEELSALQTGVTAIISGAASGTAAATQTVQVALGICTGLLASMSAVSH